MKLLRVRTAQTQRTRVVSEHDHYDNNRGFVVSTVEKLLMTTEELGSPYLGSIAAIVLIKCVLSMATELFTEMSPISSPFVSLTLATGTFAGITITLPAC